MNIYSNIPKLYSQVISNDQFQINAVNSYINAFSSYCYNQQQYFPSTDYLLPMFIIMAQPTQLCQKYQIEPMIEDGQQNQSKEINFHKKFKYAKKNAESNIVNQIFSFLSSQAKSKEILRKILKGSNNKVELFYELVKQIKKKNSKYINRDYLKNLLQLKENHMAHGILKKIDYKNIISLEELRLSFRILTKYYLENRCINVILTSAKLDKATRREHLQRRNDVFDYLMHHMKINAAHH